MIPAVNDARLVRDISFGDKTFYLDADTKIVRRMTDGLEAVRQAAWVILHTERYAFVIYSYDFGVEFATLAGSRDSFLFPEIKRRVTESLLMDNRMTGTSDFQFLRRGTRVDVQFILHTIYGDTELNTVFWGSM